jgi:adenylosuccinate lyase
MISPVDGRYAALTKEIDGILGDEAIIARMGYMELKYFALVARRLQPEKTKFAAILGCAKRILDRPYIFAVAVKVEEKECGHEVKAIENVIKELVRDNFSHLNSELVHFGATSEDIIDAAITHGLREAKLEILNQLDSLLKTLEEQVRREVNENPFPAYTHGQIASPTTFAKEMAVYLDRLVGLSEQIRNHELRIKCGGATGNGTAVYFAAPEEIGSIYLENPDNEMINTQVGHGDDKAILMMLLRQVGNVLIDLCRDIWLYQFKGTIIQSDAGTVGSTAMPHKNNPIDFENAEGNAAVANGLFITLADAVSISRMQRDLSGSTVRRNFGVAFSHLLLAIKSAEKGLSRIRVNQDICRKTLEEHRYFLILEIAQALLRKDGLPNAYEVTKKLALKLTGWPSWDHSLVYQDWVDDLDVSEECSLSLKKLTNWDFKPPRAKTLTETALLRSGRYSSEISDGGF